VTHPIDDSGFPLNPELRRLEDHLSDLAVEWRASVDQSEHANALVAEYHATLERLIQLGWDASVGELDYEELLPEHLMPEIYLRRHEQVSLPSRTG
jgi:hypothetical protein